MFLVDVRTSRGDKISKSRSLGHTMKISRNVQTTLLYMTSVASDCRKIKYIIREVFVDLGGEEILPPHDSGPIKFTRAD